MSRQLTHEASVNSPPGHPAYVFTRNNPYDREAAIEMVLPQLLDSATYMRSIREFQVPGDALAIWYMGQNGFLLKSRDSPLIGIDLYLSNSCTTTFAHLPFRLDRQVPVFIEPEDLDVDVFITTHSHDDHADPETIRRMRKDRGTIFVGPFDSQRVFAECGVQAAVCSLIHPGERLELGQGTSLLATFAMPTDATDLNHTGALLEFPNGIRFYDTGDTGYAPRLPVLLPQEVDVCAICINGGFHNLVPLQAAEILKVIRPRVATPCHYDMLVNNVGSPEMLRVAMDVLGVDAVFFQMKYYEPWVYVRHEDRIAINT